MELTLYIGPMALLKDASLSVDERTLLERFAAELRARLGDDLHAVWLFGSRARGEPPAHYSDVDVLVLVDDASWDGKSLVRDTLTEVARELHLQAVGWSFSIHVNTPAWLAQRRAIESFFIADVDRDKIALCGSL
jgi:predicted nucleotidyltransferase